MTHLRLVESEGALVSGALLLADQSRVITEQFGDVVRDFHARLRRPLEVDQRQFVEAAYSILQTLFPVHVAWIEAELAPTLGVDA